MVKVRVRTVEIYFSTVKNVQIKTYTVDHQLSELIAEQGGSDKRSFVKPISFGENILGLYKKSETNKQ